MKKFFALLFTVGAVVCMNANANAQALKVKVPFDFVVNGKIMPAATYTVARALPVSDTSIVLSGEGKGAITRATDIDSTITGTKLVFRQVAGEYFLGDVVTLNGSLHFAPSRKEKELARGEDKQSFSATVAVE
jgi:hypothetical protein